MSSLTERKRQAAEERLRRIRARKSLLDYCRYTNEDWVDGAHFDQMCEKLEAVARGEVKKLMLFAPPRHGKSELCTKRLPSWFLGSYPKKQIICCSYGFDIARDFGREVRDIIKSPAFTLLYPETSISPDVKAADRWNTSDGGIYVSAGIGGPIVGRGADLLIIDDPYKSREEAESPAVRERIWNWFWGTASTRLMPGGSMVLMMTRWHKQDLAGRLLEEHGDEWEVLKLPALNEDDVPLWPEFWGNEHHIDLRESLMKGHAREWFSQYMQEPRTEEGTYVMREWFTERYGVPPDNLNVYIASDFAVTDRSDGSDPDWTEHGVFGIDSEGVIYVLDWWSGQTHTDVWIKALIDLADKWKPLSFFGESGVIRRAVEPFLNNQCKAERVYFRKEWIAPVTNKHIRGRSFQGMAAQGMVKFPKSYWAEKVIDQCVDFPGDHDDKFDVMSLFCLALDQQHPAFGKKKKVNTAPRADWKTN